MNLSNRWLVFFLILPHLNLYYFDLAVVKPFVLIWQLAIVFIAFLTFKRTNTFNILLFFYMIIVAFSAGIMGTLTIGILFSIGIFLAFFKYISHAMNNFSELIRGLYYLFATVVLINFLTMLLGGIAHDSYGFPIYLLGGKNSVAITALPTIPIVYIYSYFIHEKLKIIPLLLILISIISIYISESGTGIVIALLSILFVFAPKRFFPSFFSYFFIYVVTFLSIVIFRLQEVFLGNFIVNVLHKDITLTGRTYIWDWVISYIKQSWLLGYGRGNDIVNTHFTNLYEAHNGILEILLFTGVLGLFFFFLILLLVGQKLSMNRRHIFSKLLAFSIFCYLIIGLTESVYNSTEFWMLLVISFGIGGIIKQQNIKLTQN